MHENEERRRDLVRFQVIRAYLKKNPPRGLRTALLEQFAAKIWIDENGEPFQVTAETIWRWIQRYQRHGLAGLRDKPHPFRRSQGCQLRKNLDNGIPGPMERGPVYDNGRDLAGMRDMPHPRRAVQALSEEVIAQACQLEKKGRGRSLNLIIRIMVSHPPHLTQVHPTPSSR